jgi:glycosyltransferase involved in cell wall biosynthesis
VKLLPITVTIITRNEASRIADAIRSVQSFAAEVIVVDSQSTDQTVSIAENLGAKVLVHPFEGFGQQKNFAHAQATQEWILNIDADERVNAELVNELRSVFASNPSVNGFYLPRKTWYLGRWVMHSGWYPNYLLRLSRRKESKWTEPALHESLTVNGATQKLKSPLEHYSFPSQKSHILKNAEYAAYAKQSLVQGAKKPHFYDYTMRPLYKFFDMYVLKLGFLDGMAGFFIAVHSSYALFLRYAYLYEDQ